MGRVIVKLTGEIFRDLLTTGATWGETHILKCVEGIPPDAELVDVSHHLFFDENAIALKFESPSLPDIEPYRVITLRYTATPNPARRQFSPLTSLLWQEEAAMSEEERKVLFGDPAVGKPQGVVNALDDLRNKCSTIKAADVVRLFERIGEAEDREHKAIANAKVEAEPVASDPEFKRMSEYCDAVRAAELGQRDPRLKTSRTKSQVLAAQNSIVGCCNRFLDYKPCQCLEEAAEG